MKTTINEILSIKDAVAEAIKEKSIKPALKMQLMLAIDPIENILNKAEEIRVTLIREIGQEDEDGNISVPKENVNEFATKLNDLYKLEVDVPKFKCTIEDFENAKNLSAMEMKLLIDFSKKYNKEVKEEEVAKA